MTQIITTNEIKTAEIKLPSLPELLSPLDDPNVWAKHSAFNAPSGVDVAFWQKEIDRVIGTTRGGEPIIKLVWNGDRNHWLEYFFEWNILGNPTAPPERVPRVRYKILRDETGKRVRDVFPPRWLLLSRLEPEQFAASWERESKVFAPEIGCDKIIRPIEPPKVFWMFFATIARHTDYCCIHAENNGSLCFGRYAPPGFYLPNLHAAKKAMQVSGQRNPFEAVDASFLSEIDESVSGYRQEIEAMEIESEIYAENPYALLGIAPSIRAGIDSEKDARNLVKDFYKRQLDETAKNI